TLEYYAVGHRPPAPGNVKGHEVQSEIVANGKVKYPLNDLPLRPAEKLSLDIGVFTPAEGGPFPAVISPSGTPPGATPLPRLPNGPNQGRGQNVLLLVGPAPSAATSPAPSIPEQKTAPPAAAPNAGPGG